MRFLRWFAFVESVRHASSLLTLCDSFSGIDFPDYVGPEADALVAKFKALVRVAEDLCTELNCP